jgi:Tfp pilus assembly protein FimT
MSRNPSPPLRRAGLTLVEVCLVLALLVVIGAMALPALEGTMSRTALTGGGAIMRGGMAKARLTAMQSGQPHVLRVEPKGARFQIVALDKLGLPEADQLVPEDPDAEHAAVDMLRLQETRLPDGVRFANCTVSASTQIAAMFGQSKAQTWSDPILFNPDGTTSDASVLLENDKGLTLRVTLRGLTGIADTGEVGREAVP